VGISEKIFEAMRTSFVLNERINTLNERLNRQDAILIDTNDRMSKINDRLIRVETVIDIATTGKSAKPLIKGKG